MKTSPSSPAVQACDRHFAAPRLARRRLVAVAGASVAAGAALSSAALRQHAEASATVAKVQPDAKAAEGYRLTDHVRRYYETTRS